MLGAGGGVRLTSSEKIIQVMNEVTYTIVVSENPLHGFCEEVEEVWSRPRPKWQALSRSLATGCQRGASSVCVLG